MGLLLGVSKVVGVQDFLNALFSGSERLVVPENQEHVQLLRKQFIAFVGHN